MGALRQFLVGETPAERQCRELVDDFKAALRAQQDIPTSGWPYLLEGPNMSLWWSQIPAFWEATYGSAVAPAQLAERVWVANRCVQLNSQQIASMPLRWHPGADVEEATTQEPAWVSNPDPLWYVERPLTCCRNCSTTAALPG